MAAFLCLEAVDSTFTPCVGAFQTAKASTKKHMDAKTWHSVGYEMDTALSSGSWDETYNNKFKWNISYKNIESLCCIPETPNIVNQLHLKKRNSPPFFLATPVACESSQATDGT